MEKQMFGWNAHRARQAGKYQKRAAKTQAQILVLTEAQLQRQATEDHQREVREYAAYWRGQGRNAAHNQPYVAAPRGLAYREFLAGWREAVAAQSALALSATGHR